VNFINYLINSPIIIELLRHKEINEHHLIDEIKINMSYFFMGKHELFDICINMFISVFVCIDTSL